MTSAMKSTIDKLNNSKTPVIKVDKALNKYRNNKLFAEKIEEANRVLKNVGLPKLQEH